MKKKSLFERIAAAPYLFWSAIFIVGPLIFVAYYAFTDPQSGNFTLENLSSLASYSGTFGISLGIMVLQ